MVCTSTGLGPTDYASGIDGHPFAPLDEHRAAEVISEWMRPSNGVMRITGSRARNLNPIVRAGDGARALDLAWWWIWPDGGGPAKFSAYNARSDRLTGPGWSRAFQQRAIVPASWFDEKGRRFDHAGGGTLGIAAITTTVRLPEGSTLISYALVTRAAAGEVANIHHRMPLVLPPDRHDAWLDPERPGTPELARAAVAWSDGLSRELRTIEPLVSAPTLF